MSAIYNAQQLIQMAVGVAVLAMMVWALVDCLRTPSDAFPAAGKRTKQLWLILTGAATAIGFVFVLSPFNIFNLLAIVAAGVYHADVKPAVRAVQGRPGPGSHMGPYGPW
jgi:CBS-domain-containing membrane protein